MSTNTDQTTQTRESKRSQFQHDAPKRRLGFAIGAVAVVIAIGAAYLLLGGAADKPATIAQPDTAASNPGEIRVPIADLSTTAKFFDYNLGGNTSVRFFIVKSGDGSYRAALDACEVCAHAKMGYKQEGPDMVCRNCGKRFNTSSIGTISSGCHPIALQTTKEGDALVIKTSQLENGRQYF